MSKKNKSPKILFYDIEISPNLGWIWGKWEQNVIEFKQEWELLSFSYKWSDETRVTCVNKYQFKDETDASVTKALWKVLNQADIIVAHNGDKFDLKKANSKFLEHGLLPPSPSFTVDTLKVAKQNFSLNSNKLNDLAKLLGLGEKVDTGGFSLWKNVMLNKRWAWRLMTKYNKQDVLLLEKVYMILRPWIKNHPPINQISGNITGCPTCGKDALRKDGVRHKRIASYQRYVCRECGSYCQSRLSNKINKKVKYVKN